MNLIQLNKTLKFLLVIATIFPLLIANAVRAVEVADLYQAKVEVASQSPSERRSALKKALAAVFIKIGGQTQTANNRTLKKAINQYNQYVTQYHYSRQQQKFFLVANFDEVKINHLFQQANLSIWGRLRPEVLVWLIEENDLARDILSDSSRSELPEMINQYAEVRGLPLSLPLMDLEDSQQVQLSDLWGRFSDATKQMSSRYMPDTILTVRISNRSLLPSAESETCEGMLCQQTSNTYAADWSLISEGQVFSQVYISESKADLVSQVLAEVADTIYQKYALSTELNNDFVIDVANIDSLSTYVNMMKFLQQLSAVEQATLVQADNMNYRIKLKLIGTKQALLASLALNNQLKRHIDPLAENNPDDIPVFYWGKL